MIESLLSKLGLNRKEIIVYLLLVQQGALSAQAIAKETGINRTTVYGVLKNLKKLQVIQEDIGSKVSKFYCPSTHSLNDMIELQEEEMKRKKLLVGDAIEELGHIKKSEASFVPKIQVYEGEEVIPFLKKRSKVWNESMAQYDSTWWGFQDTRFAEKYADWIDWIWSEPSTKELDVKVKLFSNEAEIEDEFSKKRIKNRSIKFWSGENFDSSLWVNGDYLVLVMSEAEPSYLIEIYNPLLAKSLRQVFSAMWKLHI